jgi:hypothetical protein
MRVLLKANIPTESGNKAIQAGEMGPTMQKVLAALKPEAAYFSLEGGMRTAYIVFDLREPASMPVAAEELFIRLGAQIDMTPAMTAEDLAKGLAQVG